jgi:hypothetical protein
VKLKQQIIKTIIEYFYLSALFALFTHKIY